MTLRSTQKFHGCTHASYASGKLMVLSTRHRAYMEMVAHVISVLFELTLTVCRARSFPAE